MLCDAAESMSQRWSGLWEAVVQLAVAFLVCNLGYCLATWLN